MKSRKNGLPKFQQSFFWSVEPQTNISIDISLTDQAGNTAIITHTQNYNVDHTPNSPTLDSLTFNNIDGAIISGSAYKGSKVDIYNKMVIGLQVQ